jgi:hypothetical protein
MRFKPLLALSLFFLAGCSLKLDEKLDKTTITVNPAKEGCLSNASVTLDKFFEGKIEASELDGFWNCTERALTMFSENTTGAKKDYYTPQELSSFLSKYFLKGKAIDQDLVREVMALKQGVIGGASDRITRAEIAEVLGIMKVMHAETLVLRPIMPITADNYLQRKLTPEQFEATLKIFNLSMSNIGGSLAHIQGAYSFDRLGDLFRALKKFVYGEGAGDNTWVDSALKWTDALRPAKAIFVAPPKEEIRASDWAKIYELAPRYYGIMLKGQFYFRSDTDYSSGAGLGHLESLFEETVDLMKLVLSHRPDGTIPASEIDDLFLSLDRGGMLPVKIETVRAVARALFGRIFAGRPTSATEGYSISLANIERVEDTFLFGTEGLRGIDALYRDRLRDRFKDQALPRAEVSGFNVETFLPYTAKKNAVSREALEALKSSAAEVRTIFPNRSNTVYIPAGEEQQMLSLQHMGKVHILRTLNRLLLASYSANKINLTEQEVYTLADDFFPFMQELGFVDQTTRAEMPKRLLEASIFLYASDGLTNLTMNEALELESLVISTLSRASKMHARLAESCVASVKDDKGRMVIPAACYRTQFLKQQEQNWAYIPGLSRYMSSIRLEEQQKLFLLMENFLRKGKGDAGFTTSDTQAFVLMPYYVEMLFSRFDRDRNGLFDTAEGDAAYAVFEPFLKTKTDAQGLHSPEDRRAVFNFLLAYQELPTNMKFTWVWRRYIAGRKDFKVDRGQVIKIFERLLTL